MEDKLDHRRDAARAVEILYLEDSEQDADLVSQVTKADGLSCQFTVAKDRLSFEAALSGRRFDLILCDHGISGYDGFAALRLAHGKQPDIPIIVLSGTLDDEQAVKSLRLGATDYVLKERLARLVPAIRRALQDAEEQRSKRMIEQTLRASQEHFLTFIEHAPDGVIITGPDGNYLEANTSACRMLGYEREELIGKRADECAADGDCGENPRELEFRRKDGSVFSAEVTSARMPDGNRFAMIRDVTERRKAEEILRSASRRERKRKKSGMVKELLAIFLFGAATVAFSYYTDFIQERFDRFIAKYHEQRILDELFFGLTTVVLGFFVYSYRRWRELKSEAVEQTNIEQALRSLHQELEKRIQKRTVELTKANETLRAEIEERTRAERELTSQTAFLGAQVDSALDGILVVDSCAKIVLRNERLFRIFKIPDEIAQGDDDQKWRRYIIGQIKEPERFQDRVNYLYAHPEEIGRDEIELTDGAVLDRYSAPVRDKAGKYYGRIWTFRDMTEQRKLEAQLRQSQKMEGIGQLAGGVAHDFNNILAVIQMQVDLLKDSGSLTPENLEFAEEIGATVGRAAALTRQLLLFSRHEVFQPHKLDLSESITNTAKMLRRALGETIKMQLKLAPQPMFLCADAGMMDQVLLNLCVNARDAMPDGGLLVIETSGVELDDFAAALMPQARAGSFVCLSVSDTGTGIRAEILPKIFEPFFTTKDVGKGTGLGLATVFGIAQQHQGWISVQSEVGRGTTFKIYLPRLLESADAKVKESASAQIRHGHETILLVEDDPSLRLGIRTALTKHGYRIMEAPTGVKALEVWRKYSGEIKLLVTDLVMPDGMTGRQLADEILGENPHVKVIYMSGYSPEVVGQNFPFEDGSNFLSKPFPASRLEEVVRKNLDSELLSIKSQ